jgi:hypothetical protein
MKSIDRLRHNSKVRVVEFIHCFQIPMLVLLAIITKPSILQMPSVKRFFCSFIQLHPSHAETVSIETSARCLVTGSPRLSNDTLQLIDLRLGTSESTELFHASVYRPETQLLFRHTLFLASLRARLSLLFRRSSITRRSYGASLSHH